MSGLVLGASVSAFAANCAFLWTNSASSKLSLALERSSNSSFVLTLGDERFTRFERRMFVKLMGCSIFRKQVGAVFEELEFIQ